MSIPLKSIAVLPFVNMSNDIDNEYFSDGITEEIINALTNINGLKVIARTSSFVFKGKNIDIRKVGKQLGVATVLEGSVRKSNNRLRITAQLINTKDGTHFWSNNFDRELVNVFELQDEISILIADKIRENFGHFEIQEHLVKQPTNSVQAYELFLKGRSKQLQWTPESIREAIEFYNKAIGIDRNYAKAYYANLQCYGLLAAWGYMSYDEGMALAIKNFLLAKEIDMSLPEYPHAFVGRTFWGEWDFKSAYIYIQQVLAINSNHIDGLEAMAELFIANGFFEEALRYANKLLEVDPLSANNHYTLAHIYYYQEKYKLALQTVKKAISLRPDLELAKHLQVLCFIGLKHKEAFLETIKNDTLRDLQILLYNVVHDGATVPKSDVATWSHAEKENTQLTPYQLYILANSDNKEAAFDLLGKYIQQRRGQIINYRQEPLLKSLHRFPEFENLHQSNLLISDIKTETEPSKTKTLLDTKEQQYFKVLLLRYFKDNKPYLDPQLNLTGVAEKIDIHPNKLSYLINEIMGFNFNEFINNYRLNHFKTIALDSKNSHLTILGLAYDSGFNSKSVFNTYFKKVEGVTPKAWMTSQLN